jgi:hypothetical protein
MSTNLNPVKIACTICGQYHESTACKNPEMSEPKTCETCGHNGLDTCDKGYCLRGLGMWTPCQPPTEPTEIDRILELYEEAKSDPILTPKEAITKVTAEVRRLRAELAKVRNYFDAEVQLRRAASIECERLESELAEEKAHGDRLAEALKFYADNEWNDDYPGGISVFEENHIYLDTGQRAREAHSAHEERRKGSCST